MILGERLDPAGYVGVACLLVGILALQQPWKYLRASGREDAGAAGFALLTGVMIAGYSAVDSVAVKQTEPWIYAGADLDQLRGLPLGLRLVHAGVGTPAHGRASRMAARARPSSSPRSATPGVEVDRGAGAVLDAARGRRRADHARGVSPDPRSPTASPR